MMGTQTARMAQMKRIAVSAFLCNHRKWPFGPALALGFGMFSAAEFKSKLVLPVLAAMLPSSAYPRGHMSKRDMVSLLCYLTDILHLCLAASFFPLL